MIVRKACSALAVALIVAAPVLAEDQIRQERVKFAPGATSATVKATIKGRKTIDYVLGAAAGQTMSVSLQSSNLSNYFNVLAPGSQGEAIFIGSTSGNEFAGPVAAAGDYTVRVYLMRSAARRNESANYTITFRIASGPAGTAPASDARVKGTPYHATGMVPCSISPDPKRSAQCGFGVIRGARGNADVYLAPPGYDVTDPSATRRVLKFTGSTVTATDPNLRLKAQKEGDEWSIGIDDREYYVIPDAVIFGG